MDGRSLRAWQINLARGSSKGLARATSARLVELVPMTTPSSASRYVIRVGAGSVEVGDDFDPGTLRRIVEVIRSC
jgi:hypothetical protein